MQTMKDWTRSIERHSKAATWPSKAYSRLLPFFFFFFFFWRGGGREREKDGKRGGGGRDTRFVGHTRIWLS